MGLDERTTFHSGILDAGVLDPGPIDSGRKKADDHILTIRMPHCGLVGIWILMFGLSASGCVSEPVRTYDKTFVNTYAELTLLYEKQKMEKKETDSSYKIIVKEFFDKKGIRQEEFKRRAEELSQQPQVWKFFITDVTAAIDSLKNLN